MDEYGEEEYDGHGAIRVYFSRRSIRRLEKAFGSRPVKRLAEYLTAYKVHSSHDGTVLTVGHRTKRIRRA